jgi:hypothetical protein
VKTDVAIEIGSEAFDRAHSIQTGPIRVNRPHPADPIHEIDKVRVQLVLEQGCGRGRRAEPRMPAIDDDDRKSATGERIGYHGAGQPGPDYDDITFFVARQWLGDLAETVSNQPERVR